jgi:transcriptional regulator with XRE-family HTH domain
MLERRPPLTRKALAKRVGVTQSAVCRWVRQNRFPYPRHLNKICAILGVCRQWLETGEGEKWLPKPNMSEEIRTGYTRREKLALIEDRFPEALPMLDVFLDSVVKGGAREVLGNHR